MNLYTGILFIHAIAVLVLTAALTMEAWTLLELRRVVRPADFLPWTRTIQPISAAAISSLIIIFLTGAYLTKASAHGNTPGLASPYWRLCSLHSLEP